MNNQIDTGFGAMGKPVPFYRRQAAMDHARAMGVDKKMAMEVAGKMAEALERDKPYEAMQAGTQVLDLTGTYRLMAVLCTAPKPRYKVKARS